MRQDIVTGKDSGETLMPEAFMSVIDTQQYAMFRIISIIVGVIALFALFIKFFKDRSRSADFFYTDYHLTAFALAIGVSTIFWPLLVDILMQLNDCEFSKLMFGVWMAGDGC